MTTTLNSLMREAHRIAKAIRSNYSSYSLALSDGLRAAHAEAKIADQRKGKQVDTFRITAKGRSFEQARKLLVSRGGKFDSSSKTWGVESGAISDDTARLFGLQKISAPSKTLDDIYRDWSDNQNSTY